MKKYNFILLVALAALTSCTQTLLPMATKNDVGNKSGVAKGKKIFGFGNVDASIETAAKSGGITKIATVDRTVKIGFLGIVSKYSTTVTGE